MDFRDANRAFGEKLGVTYPLLSDTRRTMLRSYQALNDSAEMVKGNRIGAYLRAKRSWYVIDKQGIVRYVKIDSDELVPSSEMIDIVKKFN